MIISDATYLLLSFFLSELICFSFIYLILDKSERRDKFLSYLVKTTALSLIMAILDYITYELYISNILLSLILFLLLSYWARKKKKPLLNIGLAAVITEILKFIIEIVVSIGATLILEYLSFNSDFLAFLIVQLLSLPLFFLILYLIKEYFFEADFPRESYILFLYAGITFVVIIKIFSEFISYTVTKNFLKVFLIVFISQAILGLVFFLILYRQARKHYQFKRQEDYLNSMIAYTEKLEDSQTNLRKFRHDYRNMLASFKYLTEKEDIAAIQSYLEELTDYSDQIFTNNFNQYQDLGNVKNKYFKSLLLTKIHDMEMESVPFYFQCPQVVEEIGLNNYDFIRMLGILLDNAIEANQDLDSDERLVNMLVLAQAQSLEIIIENPFKGQLDLATFQEKGVSNKANHSGLGLSIIQDLMATNPQLLVSYEIEDKDFIATVTIMKKEDAHA